MKNSFSYIKISGILLVLFLFCDLIPRSHPEHREGSRIEILHFVQNDRIQPSQAIPAAKQTCPKGYTAVRPQCSLLFNLPAFAQGINENIEIPQDTAEIRVPGEILVDIRDNVSPEDLQRFSSIHHITLEPNSDYSAEDKLMRVKVAEENLESMVNELSKDPMVESAEPEYLFFALFYPNDPLYKYQWSMEKTGARSAWRDSAGEGVIVAVIDTGVAFEDYKNFHKIEDLQDTKFVQGYNFVSRNIHPDDDHAHGSHVTGIIAQSTFNGKGTAGIAYKCSIMPIKVLSADGFGRVGDIAEAIRFAADHGAKVINMSLGGPFPSSILRRACQYAKKKGVIIVCAAGNSKSAKISYPAAFPECIAVSAVRYDGQIAFYSNRGRRVDIAAPGGDMNVDQNNDGYPDGILQNTIAIKDPSKEGYYQFQGTSMAAPHVSAAAALVESLGVTNPDAVKRLLKMTAGVPAGVNPAAGYGAGVVDCGKAVFFAGFFAGLLKLLMAVAFAVFIARITRFSGKKNYFYWLQTVPGILIGASGLFFLPYLIDFDMPLRGILFRGFPQWDIFFFGAGSHENPLFYSALVPFIAAIFFQSNRFLRCFAAGLNLGVGGQLLFSLIFREAVLKYIPNFFFLDELWLALNILFCLFMAFSLIAVPMKKEGVI
ncbi:MAG: S8 family peptidase [Firmicutes bacterium]|nr:S8 family peptidase [Bacillota bacterium]